MMAKSKTPKRKGLPRELVEITPLSKALAFIVVVALPIIAFFLGINYQQWYDASQQEVDASMPIVTPPQQSPQQITPPPNCYIASSCMGVNNTACKKMLVCPQGTSVPHISNGF
jgi:hypothetical protein